MPPVNPVIVSAGFIAISVAVVAAIAVYESPEVRRMADDLRRRIAVAMQSLNDSVNGEGTDERNRNRQHEGEPVFNRPEDAEGFMLSQGRRSAGDPGVVADEESRRRQREELLYWNRMQMERKKEEERKAREAARTQARTGESPSSALESLQRATRDAAAAAGIYLPSLGGTPAQPRSKTSFDQFMRPDHNADRGTFVVNTGADLMRMSDSQLSSAEDPLSSGMLRRRRPEGVRGLHTAALYANPFGDEYGIEMDEHDDDHGVSNGRRHTADPTAAEAYNAGTAYLIAPDRDETMSDIYSATEPDTSTNHMDAVFDPLPAIPEARQTTRAEVFFDVDNYADEVKAAASPATLAAAQVDSQLSLRLFRTPEDNAIDDTVVLPGQDSQDATQDANQDANQVNTEAYNSIQAWAQNSSSLPGFYSPLPVTPSVGMSEPSIISGGEMTPTGSVSVWGDDHSVVDHADAQTDSVPELVPVAAAQIATAPSVPSTTPSSSAAVSVADAGASDYGVLSEADDNGDNGENGENESESEGVLTPTSWSEVGSVVSESDAGVHAVQA
ncbi:uncharacterized protein SPSK_01648 [Sporothrix schenckii 1099-18]|uniref:Uncharacterized protein n=1 Tax=Sporothrix schenckii 1099-18 TaxID=1397361 RepID=A0A0F2MBW0_SPOSC|nr:uncharacterized protein SPSK_01648 [Sporothrix schenckii 1099-18]KJR87122.1 hypothetical protein SPSK_01648 [Sporothrix schenckii 1099-18]